MPRENTTAPAGGQAAPWFPFDASCWPDIAAAIPGRWPEAAARMDLRWWADQARMGRAADRPGRSRLMARWGWTEKEVRNLLRAAERWACPIHGDPLRSSPGPGAVQPRSRRGPDSAPVVQVEAQSGSRSGPAPVQAGSSFGPPARTTEEHNNRSTEEHIVHTSDVSPSRTATATTAADTDTDTASADGDGLGTATATTPAQPARTHVGQLLDSRSTALLVAAGITDAEDLLDHTRDSIAELCRPSMSRGRLDSIDAALRKWTRQQGEERGLRACEPRPQASAEDGQPAEAWQLLLRGLSRFEQRPPWTTTPTDDGWALPGDEDRWRAAILAAGEEPDLITSWRVLYLRAGEQDRRWQERRFATAWRRALRGAA